MNCDEVRRLFDYDQLTGDLLWAGHRPGITVGFKAGGPRNDLYEYIIISRTPYRTDSLIWCWHYGWMPYNDLDHIDGDEGNARVDNLREVLGRLDRFRLDNTMARWGEEGFIEDLCDKLTTSRGIRPIYR